MAIAVPLLLGMAGASATVATVVAVAFQVTGINNKINEAAVDVFGEDLVKVANIAGALYGAYEGLSGLGDAAVSGGMSEAVGLADAANAADTLLAGDDLMGAVEAANAASSMNAVNGFDVASDIAEAGKGFNLANMAQDTGSVLGETGIGSATKAATTTEASLVDPMATPAAQKAVSTAAEPAVAAPATNATDAAATATKTTAAAPQASAARAAAEQSLAKTPSFTERAMGLVIDPKTGNISNAALKVGGDMLSGAFGGYSASKAREQAQANLEIEQARRARLDEIDAQERARQNRLASIGLGGWRQTQ